MATATIPTRASTVSRATDWYAVSLPCERPDPYATFREVSLELATPISDEDRARRSLAVTMLARAAGRPELASRADDPDVARHRTAARVLAQYLREPGHPALDVARRMLAPTPAA